MRARIGIITYVAMRAGGFSAVEFFYNTENIISFDQPSRYLTLYFPVLGLGTLVTLITGKRGWCHYICWAGNFSALGSIITNRYKLPSLHIEAGENCVNCRRCNHVCSKSLNVSDMVQKKQFNDPECIICDNCIDNCPQRNLKYVWRWSNENALTNTLVQRPERLRFHHLYKEQKHA